MLIDFGVSRKVHYFTGPDSVRSARRVGATYSPGVVSYDVSIGYTINRSRTTAGDLHRVVIALPSYSGICLPGIQIPQVGSVSYLHFVIDYADINRLISFPFNNDLIVAREFHFGAEMPPCVGIA